MKNFHRTWKTLSLLVAATHFFLACQSQISAGSMPATIEDRDNSQRSIAGFYMTGIRNVSGGPKRFHKVCQGPDESHCIAFEMADDKIAGKASLLSFENGNSIWLNFEGQYINGVFQANNVEPADQTIQEMVCQLDTMDNHNSFDHRFPGEWVCVLKNGLVVELNTEFEELRNLLQQAADSKMILTIEGKWQKAIYLRDTVFFVEQIRSAEKIPK